MEENEAMTSSKASLAKILIVLMLLAIVYSEREVYAASYQSSWFIYVKTDPQRRHFADIKAECSFPDKVKTGEKFQVQVSLRYAKNENSTLPWIEFFDVNVQTRKTPTGRNVTISRIDTSRQRISAGSQYSGNFSIDSPAEASDYFLALVWKTYDPGAKAYNLTKPPEELQWDTGLGSDILNTHLTVQKSQAMLTIRLENIKSADIKFQGENRKIEGGELRLKLTTDTTYTVEMPKQIDIDSGTRAVFVKWSTGELTNVRKVALTDDLVAIASYKIQFLLTLSSERGNPQGGGWYDLGAIATFSVASSVTEGGLFGVKYVFERWTGDSTATTPSATIRMVGPKTVTAAWTYSSVFSFFDSRLFQVLGAVGTGGSVVLGWLFTTRKRRLVSSYLTKIDSVYNEFFMNKEACKTHLTMLRDEITLRFRKGKIDASQFGLLDRKLERYLRDIS